MDSSSDAHQIAAFTMPVTAIEAALAAARESKA